MVKRGSADLKKLAALQLNLVRDFILVLIASDQTPVISPGRRMSFKRHPTTSNYLLSLSNVRSKSPRNANEQS